MTHERRPRDSRKQSPRNSNKKQLIVVALLSAGLVVALCTQPESPSDQVDVTTLSMKPLELVVDSGPSHREPSNACLATHDLPRINLDELLHRDPFHTTNRPTVGRTREGLQITAIYGEGDDAVALIGERVVRKGQRLADGRTIVRITPDGIEISPDQIIAD